jgi:hypothetical protein
MVAGGGPSARVGAGFLVGEALALALIVTMILRSSRTTT